MIYCEVWLFEEIKIIKEIVCMRMCMCVCMCYEFLWCLFSKLSGPGLLVYILEPCTIAKEIFTENTSVFECDKSNRIYLAFQ